MGDAEAFPRGEILKLFLVFAEEDLRTDVIWNEGAAAHQRAMREYEKAREAFTNAVSTLLEPTQWVAAFGFPTNMARISYHAPGKHGRVLELKTYSPLDIAEYDEGEEFT